MGQHSEKQIAEIEAAEHEAEMDSLVNEIPYNQYMEKQFEEQKWEELEKQNLSALQQFEKGLTKIDIKEMATTAVETCLQKGNPLQVAEALSGMELFIKEVKDDPCYKNYVREEIGKYPKGFTSKSGAKLECAETGTKYDFSKCADPELERLEQLLEVDKMLLDQRKDFLKTVPESGMDTITADGEVVKVFRPSKSSTSSYKVTLSRGF